MAHLAGARVLGLDAHADLHRGAPRGVHPRAARQQLADLHRVQERHAVDRRGHDAAAGVLDRRDARRLVAHLHHGAAVHEAGAVGLLDPHPADQGGFGVTDGARVHAAMVFAEEHELLLQPAPGPGQLGAVASERRAQRGAPRSAAAESGLDLVERHEPQVLGLGEGAAQLSEAQHGRDVEQGLGWWGDGQALVR